MVNKMGSLIEYFQQKKTTAVLEKAIDHAKKVQECIIELQNGFKTLIKERNFDEAHEIFLKVDKLEGEADNIRRDILADISKGALNPNVRTDLSHLIKKLDQVANCANGAGRRLDTVPMSFWEQTSEESLELIKH